MMNFNEEKIKKNNHMNYLMQLRAAQIDIFDNQAREAQI